MALVIVWLLVRRLRALENLLANALRYVPAGCTVEPSIQRIEAPAGDRFRMTIADDGPGLPPEEIPHLFERFYRSPAARGTISSHEVGGSGLGLAIVREIVHRHGGTVRASARTPHGLAIDVEIPALEREPRVAA